MAKRKVNVSEAIRTYLTDNPDIGPKEAAEAISKQTGKKVSPIYVSNVKSMMKKGAKKGRRGRKPGLKSKGVAVVVSSNGAHTYDLPTIEGMMKIVKRIGRDAAKRLADLLE